MNGPRPLAGVRVLDLSEVVAGPVVGRVLADLGADVIKIERPTGDITRTVTPEVDGQSVYFAQLNAGKRNIGIDLRNPASCRLVADLAEHVDVLLENFRPGVLAKRGLGAATLLARNPRLVYCSISGWGQTGPWSQRRAYAPLIHAETGLLELSARLRRRPPEQEVHVVADLNTGFFACSAILAALYQRTITGEGQHLDVAMADVALYSDDWAAADCVGAGDERFFDIWNHPVVMLADGSHATLVGNRSRMFERFVVALGGDVATVCADPHLADFEARDDNRALVDEVLRQLASNVRDFADLEARFEQAGLMAAPLRSVGELAATPWAREREVFRDLGADVRVPAAPWRSDRATIGVAAPAADRGAHTDEVLRDLLGLDDDAIARMRRDHICE